MKKKVFCVVVILLVIGVVSFRMHKYDAEIVAISIDSSATTEDKLVIKMSTKDGYRIFYTLDGSIPSREKLEYKDEIQLDRNSTPENLAKAENVEKMIQNGINTDSTLPRGTIIRAAALAPDGSIGPIETRTYFIGIDLKKYFGNAAIFSLVTDPSNLLDYETGNMVKGKIFDEWANTTEGRRVLDANEKYEIVGNYTQKGKDWEREAVLELFDNSNSVTWRHNVGYRLKGNKTRFYSQKSFNIYFREEYGTKKLKYKLFDNAKNVNGDTINEYKSFSFRNGGNDTEYLKYKDAMIQHLVEDRNIDTQASRIAILFINGEYWGVYNLQEKYSNAYYANHYNVNKDNVIVIKENEVDEGKDDDIKLYNELMKYADMDLSDNNNYDKFLKVVDIESMLDYFAIEVYIANGDWGEEDGILKNTQLWRVREVDNSAFGDGKWRWSLYDTEYSSSLYGQEKTNLNYNTIEQAKRRQPLFASAMRNADFRNQFYRRLKEIGSTNFEKNRVNKVMSSYEQTWNNYSSDYYKRFGDNSFYRENSFVATKYFFNNRLDVIMNY